MIPATSVGSRPSARVWRRVTRLDAVSAACWYVLLTLALTWPVGARLATGLPNDLGDPLFSSWLLQWNLDHMVALARGDLGAIGRYWNANIFYPEPLALLYSDHYFALGLQALPVWVLTHNLLLCYNLIFLSTFALAGLGTFLLVRELTGNARAAFVAGLLYAFSPYRVAQLGHIQVLSAQWMPFVLFGLRRFFDRSAPAPSALRPAPSALRPPPSPFRPLAGASLALVAQSLSCGYYLLYFPPFVAAYALWEIARRGLWRNWRTGAALTTAGATVSVACLPFLLKYHELRLRGFEPRPLEELRGFSADTFAYLHGVQELWLWPGGFTSYDKAEGQLFPGVTPVVLALVGLACLAVALRRRTAGVPPLSGWRLAIAAPIAVAGIAAVELARFELFAGRWIGRVRNAWPWLSDIRHVFLVVAACGLVLLAVAPRARLVARLALTSGRVFLAAAFLVAVWLSFGPLVTTQAHGIAPNTLYTWLYGHVPGFDGLRVPARFGMLALLFLAVLGGYGAAAIERLASSAGAAGLRARVKASSVAAGLRARVKASSVAAGLRDRVGGGLAHLPSLVLPAVAAFFLLEASAMPLAVRRIEWPRQDRPGTVSAAELDRLYAFVRKLPADTVVAEFPFGTLQAETRAVYLSTRHAHPIVNGYSGGFPAGYQRRLALLDDPVGTGDPAWRAILDSGATCLVVHEWALQGGNGRALSAWLEAHGALPLATFKSDRLFKVAR